MKVITFHRSAFERQIQEAVLIQANIRHHILNSKSEYNQFALPRLGTKLGEKETSERGKNWRRKNRGARVRGEDT